MMGWVAPPDGTCAIVIHSGSEGFDHEGSFGSTLHPASVSFQLLATQAFPSGSSATAVMISSPPVYPADGVIGSPVFSPCGQVSVRTPQSAGGGLSGRGNISIREIWMRLRGSGSEREMLTRTVSCRASQLSRRRLGRSYHNPRACPPARSGQRGAGHFLQSRKRQENLPPKPEKANFRGRFSTSINRYVTGRCFG